MKADLLRENFLNFFKAKKHKIIASDSLVPKDDPTVLFTPAGMNQFKREFLGHDSGFSRAATCQRCLRTDDLDKVGKTSGHHTFFEMLGNFSFGNYFKREAILWAWEFLTEELKIQESRLWVSVYEDDDEAYNIWREIVRIPKEKIIKLGDKENFWPSEAKEKGPNGPCGPCSEIFFDQGSDVGCQEPNCDPSCSCGRFVEVWNLVFTQFNRCEGGILERLAKKNIDTGMGLERLAAVMQGVENNFQTDLFQPIIKEIIANNQIRVQEKKELIYAVADHIRAITFAIYDGALPSNEARGYVVRKLIRKSSYSLTSMGITKPFLYKLVPVVSEVMRLAYPELDRRKENIAEIILAEEKSFMAILKSSDNFLKKKFNQPHLITDPIKSADLVFELYDTYGLPLELSKNWLRQRFNAEISPERLNQNLELQRNRSRLQSAMKDDVFQDAPLDFKVKETKFLGFKDDSVQAKILKVIKGNAEVKKITQGDEAKIILDKTAFYPESGGQIGDTGELAKGKNIFSILDTKKIGKVIVHLGQVKAGSFKKDGLVLAKIDVERRLAIARNHTATHLLQAALRKVLGEHVRQQGSLVAESRLRFDFTHFKALDRMQLDRVEDLVNHYIMNNYRVEAKEQSLHEAKRSKALAFFKEKYESKVRVISINGISLELCGGTHLNSTGQIGLFKIIQEGSVASGIRRIEAFTGTFAYKKIKEEHELVLDLTALLDVPADKILPDLEKRFTYLKGLEKQLNLEKLDALKSSLDNLIGNAQVIKSMRVIAKVLENVDIEILRKNVDLIKEKTNNSIIIMGAKSQGRAQLVMGVTSDLCQKGIDAGKLIREIAGIIGGSGGGRQDFAQAGGNKPENLEQALGELKNKLMAQ